MMLIVVAFWKHVLHKNICKSLYFFIGINTAIIIQNIWFVDFGLSWLRSVKKCWNDVEKDMYLQFCSYSKRSYFNLHQCVVFRMKSFYTSSRFD